MKPNRSTYTRRSALRLMATMGTLAVWPRAAIADTQNELSGAQAKLAEAQAELDAIASEYEELSTKQSKTLDQIEKIKGEIEAIELRIAELEKKLQKKRDELSLNVSEEYKDGNHGIVDLLLRSKTIEDFISNFYYYDKVTQEEARLIQEVKDTRAECEEQKIQLTEQQLALEEESKKQAEQLDAMRDKQWEAQVLIDSLDNEVRELIAKRDAELLAAQQEAERARKEREKAAQAASKAPAQQGTQEHAASPATTSSTTPVAATASQPTTDSSDDSASSAPAAASTASTKPEDTQTSSASTTEDQSSVQEVQEKQPEPEQAPTQTPEPAQPEPTPEPTPEPEPEPEPEPVQEAAPASGGSAAAVVAACYSTPSPGLGLCAGWCSNVMINAGYGFVPGNANDMYANYCFSTDRSALSPGMAIAVSTHPHTSAGRIYGHIGMYVGNGMMMDNVGYIRTISVDEWISFYAQTVPARWGWLNGIVLS